MDLFTAIIIILFTFFILRGAWRGFSGELAHLIGLITFIATLWYGYPPTCQYVQRFSETAEGQTVIFYAALLTTLFAAIVLWVTFRIARHIIGMIIPQPFNALLGAAVGALKVFLLVSVAGGLLTVAQDRFKTLREQTERNPFAAIVAQFWVNRFNQATHTAFPDVLTPPPSLPVSTQNTKDSH